GGHRRPAQQADRRRARHERGHRQGAARSRDAEDAGGLGGRAGADGRAPWRGAGRAARGGRIAIGMSLRNAGLHTKLMLALALLVALVAGGSAHFVIEFERERRLLELDNRAARIAEVFSRSLAQPLRDLDRRAIDSQISARFPDPEVVEISVTAIDHGPMTVVAGARG